jgi:hypothetical protein
MSDSAADQFVRAMTIEHAKEDARNNEVYELGRQAGAEWAKQASAEAVAGLVKLDEEADEQGFGDLTGIILDVLLPGDLDHAASIVTALGSGGHDAEAAARRFFGDYATYPHYLAGWCYGALELWDDVKDQVEGGDGE